MSKGNEYWRQQAEKRLQLSRQFGKAAALAHRSGGRARDQGRKKQGAAVRRGQFR